MARAPLLQLTDIALTFGGDPVFSGLDLVVHQGDRVALVGRNGSGKSTLMKVMAGLIEPDRGTRVMGQGLRAGYMEQHPDLTGFATLGDFAGSGLDPHEGYRVERVAEGLKFDPARACQTASGGERRRAALAKLIAEAPELMLLDEPTNHLDIEAIRWLEDELSATRTAFVLISHDRAFLRQLTRATLWIDRGQVRRQERGFEAFEDWRDKTWDDEDTARHKLDRKIKAEARWAVEGISARRKRNMGRVRALHALRAERAGQIRRQGAAAMALEAGPQSGRRVIEARGISKAYDGREILRDFSALINRGDRVALVGPNGVGKTTLLNMLIGVLAPDSGSVKLGTGLEIAVFDQNRASLDADLSLWDALAGDPEIGVQGKADQVMVRGTPKHVVGYLKEFLFDEAQARAPVRALSGGEKARLILARIMARQSNLLVLDEPTNDLDVETLDLLQDLLGSYDGTVLLVSHDRDFLDRVAATTIAMEGDGRAVLYAGGWSDYLAQRGGGTGGTGGAGSTGGAEGRAAAEPGAQPKAKPKPAAPKSASAKPAPAKPAPTKPAPTKPVTGLSFTERHRLAALPDEIDRLSAEIARLEAFLADPELFTRAPDAFRKASEGLVERQQKVAAAELEWLDLMERDEG